jgi:hypothetical protein
MLIRYIALACALVVSTPTMAADLSGAWAVKSGGTTIYRFEIAKTAQGWSGTWERPQTMQTNGEAFDHLAGPIVRRVASKAIADGDSLDLTFEDPRPGAIDDVFRIQTIDATHAKASFPTLEAFGMQVDPEILVRESSNAPLGGWDTDASYPAPLYRPTNAEMTAIFDADQQSRANWPPKDMTAQEDQDQQRRARTGELLDQGALHSGDDFYHAAFVYQHGDKPDDFLKAHILAMVAVSKGKPDAKWIAAATLDRYLQNIGRPQVFGTQYFIPKGGKVTQEPYNRALMSDALRAVMGVPSMAKQDERLKSFGTPPPAKP